jgi:hypothetical protein
MRPTVGYGFTLLLLGALAFGGCNSGSVAGTQPKASSTSTTETKTTTPPTGARTQGLFDAVSAKTK